MTAVPRDDETRGYLKDPFPRWQGGRALLLAQSGAKTWYVVCRASDAKTTMQRCTRQLVCRRSSEYTDPNNSAALLHNAFSFNPVACQGTRGGGGWDVLVGGVGACGSISTQARVHLAALLEEAPQLRGAHNPSDQAPRGHAALVHAGAGACAVVIDVLWVLCSCVVHRAAPTRKSWVRSSAFFFFPPWLSLLAVEN